MTRKAQAWAWVRAHRLLVLLALAGLVLHGGTAVLRVGTFVPYPRLRDFAGFYASAWAMRQGASPYGLSEEHLTTVRAERHIPFRPPAIYNPPTWPWLLHPLTVLPFPAAAWLWLLLNLGLLAGVAYALSRMAGYDGWLAPAVVFGLGVTFGPTFLDLTLGQTSVVLLAAAVAVGRSLRGTARRAGALAEGVATVAKLFPLLWLAAPALSRRWKALLLGALAALIGLGIGFVVAPAANRTYWFHDLPRRVTMATGEAEMDDQSLGAWVDRLGRPHSYRVPGLRTSERVTVTWTPPWSVPADVLRWVGYALAGLLGGITALVILRAGPGPAEGAFYLWVLYTLAIFPHIDRYNHTLLLPAMAWLWGQGERLRLPVAGAYLLAGLSRLNHLWMMILPAPWGPLASGFGLYAVLLLGAGIVDTLQRPKEGLCPTTS
jgi:alpha-1,2-mannosyltransferase